MTTSDMAFEDAYHDLKKIKDVIRRYHEALNRRENGNVAAHNAMAEIMETVDMPWVQKS